MAAVERVGPRRRCARCALLGPAFALAPFFAFASTALTLAACTTGNYRPFPVAVPEPVPQDLFGRCAEVLRGRYGRLPVADPVGFRLQTDWVAVTVGERSVRRRATVFREGRDVAVLVEARYLRGDLLGGSPEWTGSVPDPDAEGELGRALADAFGP